MSKKERFVTFAALILMMGTLGLFLSKHLEATIYGSVKGQVTGEDTGKGVPGVGVMVDGPSHKRTVTDKEGKFSLQELRPGEYNIFFYVVDPYCSVGLEVTYVDPSKITIFNQVLKVGGSISGTIYKGDGVTPFPDVDIYAYERFTGRGSATSGEDGSYFIGMRKLCPSDNYRITANCKIPGYAYKIIQGIPVEKGEETTGVDMIFDLDDITGIEGYVTSSIDGKPLSEVVIRIRSLGEEGVKMGRIISDANGYYSIRGLNPGIYDLRAFPLDDNLSFQEWSSLNKSKDDIVVIKEQITRVDFRLDVQSSS